MAYAKIDIPIFEAEMLMNHDISGGTSKPWIVTVDYHGEPSQYIIKPFSNRDLNQIPYINKEFYALYLAQEFEIDVPDPALISLTPEFIETLEGTEKARIDDLKTKLVFGCKYHEGFIEYVPGYNPKSLSYLNPETVFAFDVLIRNFDRTIRKPNLITSGNEYLCIDHERALDIHKSFSEYEDHSWDGINTSKLSPHLFYDLLKQRQKIRQNVDFHEFDVLLKRFRIGVVEEVADSLISAGLPADDCEPIMDYFKDVLANKKRLFNLLKFLLG